MNKDIVPWVYEEPVGLVIETHSPHAPVRLSYVDGIRKGWVVKSTVILGSLL